MEDLISRRVSHSQAQRPQPVAQRRARSQDPHQRYQQQVPGHQIQVDVKFLKFDGKEAPYEILRERPETNGRCLISARTLHAGDSGRYIYEDDDRVEGLREQ